MKDNEELIKALSNNKEFIEALLKLKEYQELERKKEIKQAFCLLGPVFIISAIIIILTFIFA